MIINHNIASLNTYRQLTVNNSNSARSLEKLSSGLRINRAGDDAAGLAISEKMRGQIRGLDMAAKNSQDAISMIQTAEGNLSETHSILQRMKELATQAANDTNVGIDRGEIQKEMNQLSSEINRIGNTTEFNAQKLLQGDGKANLTATTKVTNSNLTGGAVDTIEATQTITLTAAATAGQDIKVTLNGQELAVTFRANTAAADNSKVLNVTANSADVNLIDVALSNTATTAATDATKALQEMIDANAALKGNFTVSSALGAITIEATKSGLAAGAAGNIADSGGTVIGATAAGNASVGTTTYVKAAKADVADFSGVNDAATAKALVGTGLTIAGQQIEFYNANDGAYKGSAIGVNLSDVINAGTPSGTLVVNAIVNQAGSQMQDVELSEGTAGMLTVTAKVGGTAGNNLRVTDGGVQEKFQATFQVGSNQGQSFAIDINDMRSAALGIAGKAGGADAVTGAKFTTATTVTNGTDAVVRESALDVSNYTNATNAIKTLGNAIESVSAERSKLGAFQNRLEHTINNLGTSSENLTAAESRIRDVDMAKEMMQFTKNNILTQAATAMLAQANTQPQGVLQLLK